MPNQCFSSVSWFVVFTLTQVSLLLKNNWFIQKSPGQSRNFKQIRIAQLSEYLTCTYQIHTKSKSRFHCVGCKIPNRGGFFSTNNIEPVVTRIWTPDTSACRVNALDENWLRQRRGQTKTSYSLLIKKILLIGLGQ